MAQFITHYFCQLETRVQQVNGYEYLSQQTTNYNWNVFCLVFLWFILRWKNSYNGPLESYVRGKRKRENLSVPRPQIVFFLCCLYVFCLNIWIPRQRLMLDPTTVTAEDIKAAEKYVWETVLDGLEKRNNNREEMMEKFKLTRESRRAYINAK